MKKFHFFIIILIVITVLATGDYLLNIEPATTTLVPAETKKDPIDLNPNLTQTLLAIDPQQFGYQITSRNRTNQIFEKIDLGANDDFIVYRNELQAIDGVSAPVVIYEVQGGEGQGSLTYLNIKLKFINQIVATDSINETGDYGNNSFFINDKNHATTGFLMAQMGNHLFGFQFDKNDFEILIKPMIDQYMITLTSN